MTDTLRARIIRELRAAARPLDTGWLARRCAWAVPYPTQYTLIEFRRLEACGVVVRRGPVNRGKGRPPLCWELRRSA